jgi:hypothetical protein
MRCLLVSVMIMMVNLAGAQHCPWDCSGLLLFKIEISKKKTNKLFPVLVNEKKEIIVDTIYGTSKSTFDTCKLLFYDDFQAYRIKRVTQNKWYAIDTVYHFAEGYYIIKVNFCKYRNKKIFLRFTDTGSKKLRYRYVEIANSSLIHLHDYNMEITARKTDLIKEAIAKYLITIDCASLGLKEENCR